MPGMDTRPPHRCLRGVCSSQLATKVLPFLPKVVLPSTSSTTTCSRCCSGSIDRLLVVVDFVAVTLVHRYLSQTLMELQPRDAASGEGIMSPEQMVGSLSETILDKFGEKKFDVEDIARSLEEAGPYQNVFMQVSDDRPRRQTVCQVKRDTKLTNKYRPRTGGKGDPGTTKIARCIALNDRFLTNDLPRGWHPP